MMSQITFPSGTQFANLAAIKAAIKEARDLARADAVETCGGGVIQSRGCSLRVVDAKGNLLKGEAESWMWSGTGKSLLDAVMEARYTKGASELSISGGFNYAETPRALADGDYDPWVTDWEVVIWKREPEKQASASTLIGLTPHPAAA
ncbi:hypothetical protein [Piscinibacter gummiphilus]|uniref:Uncharacterized protein n=1 Tax=Piscinibacter gummiphilus TaxID=946333 RepID=A0ABZ0CNC6_9BURK|nr:hypothetical protein [Piscinibacter gummiphilus]WOB06490.1 hypothetical protein RXV79_16330 [Piscinibacter gummiphilus]